MQGTGEKSLEETKLMITRKQFFIPFILTLQHIFVKTNIYFTLNHTIFSAHIVFSQIICPPGYYQSANSLMVMHLDT